jgi:hypothetical protein
MLNGLFKVEFQTSLGAGAGVVVLQDGKVLGGDSMMAYIGTFTESGQDFSAKVEGKKHSNMPGMTSVFGVDHTHITLTGKSNGSTSVTMQGKAAEAPNVPFQAKLTKIQ